MRSNRCCVQRRCGDVNEVPSAGRIRRALLDRSGRCSRAQRQLVRVWRLQRVRSVLRRVVAATEDPDVSSRRNHEYLTSGGTGCDASGGAGGYLQYFGDRAGPSGRGYYSFDYRTLASPRPELRVWHIGGCGQSSPQETWLTADLTAHPAACTMAFYHRPRFGPTTASDTPALDALWKDLEANHVDVVLNGHVHAYDRFSRLGSSGRRMRMGFGSSSSEPEAGAFNPSGRR
jgi:hypothetical protein